MLERMIAEVGAMRLGAEEVLLQHCANRCLQMAQAHLGRTEVPEELYASCVALTLFFYDQAVLQQAADGVARIKEGDVEVAFATSAASLEQMAPILQQWNRFRAVQW